MTCFGLLAMLGPALFFLFLTGPYDWYLKRQQRKLAEIARLELARRPQLMISPIPSREGFFRAWEEHHDNRS